MRRSAEGGRAGSARPDRQKPGTPFRPWAFRALRVLVLGVAFSIPGVPAAFLLMPMPRGADGVTLCLPGIGPLQQFAEGMEPDLEEIVHIHERVHAEQCRRLGALGYARAYVRDEGMIELEAEAFCAEAHTLALRGAQTGPWVSRIIDILYLEYPHDESVSYGDITRIVARHCPPPDARSRPGPHP